MSWYPRKDDEIRIWPYDKAPAGFREIVPSTSEWVAVIPRTLASASEIGNLLWRWDDRDHPVIRRDLADGSIILAGSYPTMMTMTPSAIEQTADTEFSNKRRKR